MGGVSQMGAKGANTLSTMADVLFGNKPILPTEAEIYLGTILGKKSPITEENFTELELDYIRDQIEHWKGEGKSYVGRYIDLENEFIPDEKYKEPREDQYSLGPAYRAARGGYGATSAEDAVTLSLGRYKFDETADGYRVTDEYDFNPEQGPSRGDAWKHLVTKRIPWAWDDLTDGDGEFLPHNLYGIASSLAEAIGPRGGDSNSVPRPVDVLVPYGNDEKGQMNRKRIIQQLLSGM